MPHVICTAEIVNSSYLIGVWFRAERRILALFPCPFSTMHSHTCEPEHAKLKDETASAVVNQFPDAGSVGVQW